MLRQNTMQEHFGEDLRPRYYLENDTIKVTVEEFELTPKTPEVQRQLAEMERNNIIKRERTLNEKPEFFNEIHRVDVDKIGDMYVGWNLFDPPSKIQQLDLMRSIEAVGLLNPIYVVLDGKGNYNVLCGRCRLIAYCNLFQATGLEKYKCIPCYVIPFEEVDELYLRNMIFESNIQFRTISKYNMICCLLENYELMKKTKMHRNEKNIGMELAEQFDISESTVFNFLKVKKLCDEARTLLYDERITLKSALYLTNVSKETQKNILETYGVKGVNTIFRLKLLTKEGDLTLEQIKRKIEEVEKIVPEGTSFTFTVSGKIANSFISHVLDFKRTIATELACRHLGKFNKVFKVRGNNKDLQIYLEKEMVDPIELKKLLSSTISEMARIK